MTQYENPWRSTPSYNGSGPEYYSTDAKPTEYKGFLLYNRIPGTVCDIVKNGWAVGQVVTPRGAKRHIDSDFGKWRINSNMDLARKIRVA